MAAITFCEYVVVVTSARVTIEPLIRSVIIKSSASACHASSPTEAEPCVMGEIRIVMPSCHRRSPSFGVRVLVAIAARVAALLRFHHSRCDRLRVPGSQQKWRLYRGSITLVAAAGYDISYERNHRYSVSHKTHTNVSECGEVTIPLLPIACGLRVRVRVRVRWR